MAPTLVSQPVLELEGQALSDVHNREVVGGSILVTYPDVKVSYVELMKAIYSREQLRQVTNGNAFSEVIVSNDPPNQLSIRHSGANTKYTAITTYVVIVLIWSIIFFILETFT